MPLTSDINSSSFHLGMEVLRAQVAATGRGEFTMGGETVRIEYSPTDGRFLASDGTGGLFTELLLLGFNNGPQALGERMLSILSGSDAGETQSQVTPQDKIYQCKFLLIQRASSVPLMQLDAQLYWKHQKKGYLSKIQIVQQYALYLMLMHFLAWLMTVQFTL